MTFLKNTWYAAGFAEDFSRTPVRRMLLENDLVFYRRESGELVALGNRCPHRFAPLHRGQVIGDTLRCAYHGLQFAPTGECVHNPIGDGKIPRAATTKAWQVAERDGLVWLWFGDEPADESKIRRYPQFTDPSFETVQGTLHVRAEYQLVVDNLLDLSHAEFLHPYLATEGFNRRTQYSLEQEGVNVIAKNWRPNEPITALWRLGFLENVPSTVDHRSIVSWLPPSTLHIEIGVTRVGRPSSEGPVSHAAHVVTPETAGSCHYFWKWARNFRLGEAEFARTLQGNIQSAFETEDEPMIEAQYECMGGQPLEAMKPVLLPTDSGSMRARRVLKQLIEAQDAATKAAASP